MAGDRCKVNAHPARGRSADIGQTEGTCSDRLNRELVVVSVAQRSSLVSGSPRRRQPHQKLGSSVADSARRAFACRLAVLSAAAACSVGARALVRGTTVSNGCTVGQRGERGVITQTQSVAQHAYTRSGTPAVTQHSVKTALSKKKRRCNQSLCARAGLWQRRAMRR